MKVLLINPPSNSPQPVMPLGLAYLAASLEKSNIPVEVIDAWAECMDYNLMKECMSNIKDVNLVGITVMSPTYSIAIETIRLVHEILPNSKIIVGGTHPSSLPKQCLEDNPEIDFVCVGEGDDVIVQLAKAMENGGNMNKIKGLWYREDGKVISNGVADSIKNLDDLPFPARHLFPMSKYKIHPPYRLYKSFATMIISRGCPYQCAYCTKSVSGQNFRYQSSERVIAEIEYLKKQYNIKQILFYDDDFTINKKRAEELCDEIIKRKIKITWSCVTRVDLVNKNLLEKMKQAGCFLISYGVESGNQQILNNVRKGYKIEDIKKAFKLTKEAKIRTLGYFMAGLPGETYETLNDTINLLFELEPDFTSWSITVLYPGSKLFEQALKGELNDNYVSAHMNDDNVVVSSRSPFSQGHAYVYKGNVPREYILKTIEKVYRRFYFRIGYIIRFITKLRTFTEVLSYAKTFIQYIGWKEKR